ncbi:hypothetical protein OOU_Y34scaffold00568g7, partial [Pyricularia oryzae Y34]
GEAGGEAGGEGGSKGDGAAKGEAPAAAHRRRRLTPRMTKFPGEKKRCARKVNRD